jgi:exo-beta-1,3-glucanase (GH17 family)
MQVAMRLFFRLFILALAIGLNIYYWQWLGKPVELPDVPHARYDCLSYTPYTEGHDPTNPDMIIDKNILDADMKSLAEITDCIRLYSSRGSTPLNIEAAKKYGIKVILGAWVGGNDEHNRAEIDNAIKLANQYSDVIKMVVVGNEVLLRQELPYDVLGGFITEVKNQIPVPVAYADVYDFWIQYPQMADYVDIILVHLLPYWGDPAPTSAEAQNVLEASLKDFLQRFKGRNIMIGETGWPSAGPPRQEAVASIVDQARFVRNFIQSANQLHVPYNLIEALDQPWKRGSEGTAGGYWGIKNVDRSNKFPLTGPVSEWPEWRIKVGIAIVLGILISLWAIRRSENLLLTAAIIFASQIIGTLCIFTWRMAQENSQSSVGFVLNHAAILLILVSSALAFWLLQAKGNDHPVSFRQLLTQANTLQWTSVSTWQTLCLFIGTFSAAIITLALAVEMRHQDIPWPLFAGSALLAIATIVNNQRNQYRLLGRIEAWLALILLLGAPWCFDGWNNEAAMLWQAAAVIIALPWLSAIRNEIRLLVSDKNDGN